jgi:uncharacterized membrane protein
MRYQTSSPVPRAAVLGFAAGLRSQLPSALVIAAANRGDLGKDPGLLGHRLVRLGSAAAALGELIADKTPYVPARTEPGPFAGRLFFGGLTGALYARTQGTSAPTAFAVAAIAAGLGTLAGYRFRSTLTRATGLPDLPIALTEDLLAFTLAALALRE